jgi:hypothetical protein
MRSEFTANQSLQRQAIAAWMKPGPVRTYRKPSMLSRLINLFN